MLWLDWDTLWNGKQIKSKSGFGKGRYQAAMVRSPYYTINPPDMGHDVRGRKQRDWVRV